MMVVPLKWLPYLLIFGGLCCMISGEDEELGLGMLAAGGIWLFLKHKGSGKSGSGSKNASAGTAPQITVNRESAPQEELSPETSSGAVKYCPRCGQANPADALFCYIDGERLL